MMENDKFIYQFINLIDEFVNLIGEIIAFGVLTFPLIFSILALRWRYAANYVRKKQYAND